MDGRQLTSKARFLLFLAVSGFFIAVFFNMYLANQLHDHDYGDFKVAEAFFNLGAMIAMLGGGGAAIRFLGKPMAEGKSDVIWEFVRTFTLLILLCSGFLALLIWLASIMHWHFMEAELHPLMVMAFSIPFGALTLLLSGVLQTAKRSDLAYLPWMLLFPTLQFGFCVFLKEYLNALTEFTAVLATMAAALGVAVLQVYFVFRLRLVRMQRAPHSRQTRVWLVVALPMMFISALQIAISQIDIYMLEILGNEAQVGHFAAAVTTVNFYYLLKMAVARACIPYMLEAWSLGREATVFLNRRGFQQLFSFSTVLAVICIVMGEEILSLYGDGHDAAFSALMILLVGYVPFTVLGMSADWLKYVGHERFVMVSLALCILTNVCLNTVLIPAFGMNGAALATAISMVGYTIVLTLKQRQILGIYPWSESMPVAITRWLPLQRRS
ncbi:Uncharacterised protein [BD1-7 clade bacterium]|uniref:Polysaccharide biosynthesis protein C-terminal domain-containing protein n=1 Tax=BD1-7 clade bacterium TaxID=2029982 RepID=A0A5S9QFR2_9GAMM|nr:Uncharacterised protein [BD1-7 clade bacterium]CAA0117409.1 Uncharacterised protein [BD1-7 clade bacterium]